MIINTRYNRRDTVYQIRLNYIQERSNCDVCDHTGVIVFKDKNYKCPECSGYKTKVKTRDGKWEVLDNQEVIDIIDVIVIGEDDSINITYKLLGSYSPIHESKLFKTIEEAQLECNRLNNLINEKR